MEEGSLPFASSTDLLTSDRDPRRDNVSSIVLEPGDYVLDQVGGLVPTRGSSFMAPAAPAPFSLAG